MRKKLLFLVSSIALLVSCNSENDEQEKVHPDFRYIFEITDSIFYNGRIMASNVTSSYDIELIHSEQDYLKECNQLNFGDCVKVELFLDIAEGATLFYETVVKYTRNESFHLYSDVIGITAFYGTIRYELSKRNNLIICENIWVNDELYWSNQGNDVLPRVVIIAKPRGGH